MMKTRQTQRFSAALLGAVCACAAGLGTPAFAQRTPIGTNLISLSDFDNASPSGFYGYFYQNSGDPQAGTYTTDRAFLDPIIPMENGPYVFRYTFDNTPAEALEASNPGNYSYGTGFGAWQNLPWSYDRAVFNSTDLGDYILSWDARVEGLLPDQTNANCQMEFRLYSGNLILQKNIPYQPGSNWAHFVFHLDEGGYAEGTSYETFTNGISLNNPNGGVTSLGMNQNQHRPHPQFGFDTDNAIFLDNLKLEVIQYEGPPPPPPPKVAYAIFDYNFDDKDVWWAWPSLPTTTAGWSQNANRGTYWAVRPAVGAGVDGTQGFAIAMDNTTLFNDPPGIPQWAGGNVASGGPCNYAYLNSPDLKDYQFNFQARAEGLAEGRENTPVVVQIYFNAPDDTLQPPDANSDRDMLLRLNVGVQGVTRDWQTYVISLKEGAVNAGTLANFQAHYSKVEEIQFQLQIQNPHQSAVWGIDADNLIFIDNFKLERLVTGTPPLHIEKVGANVVVTWGDPSTGSVKLYSGNSLDAINDEVVNATSPYTRAATGSPRFFRTQWVPPDPEF
jgi:hypothetical protein